MFYDLNKFAFKTKKNVKKASIYTGALVNEKPLSLTCDLLVISAWIFMQQKGGKAP